VYEYAVADWFVKSRYVLLQAISAGSEVLISYLGEKPSKSSTQLMKDYGFILPGNTNDSLTFKVQGAEQAVCSQGSPHNRQGRKHVLAAVRYTIIACWAHVNSRAAQGPPQVAWDWPYSIADCWWFWLRLDCR
jgi:hypothetical protein